MNTLVKKYMGTCDQGEKLNIGAYLKDVCTTNKSFFYPEDFEGQLDFNNLDGYSFGGARRSSIGSEDHSPSATGHRNSSHHKRGSVYESSIAT